MLFNIPLHPSKADRIIEQFDVNPGSRVLDAGCGEGEFLVRVAERYAINGFGLDLDRHSIEKAQAKARQRVKSGSIDFIAKDVATFTGDGKTDDLVICLGAEFIFGGYVSALQKLKALLAPNSLLLMGTIFWKQEPASEYLQLMGGDNPHFDHATTVELATQQGFIPFYVCRSSEDEWDDFESSVSQRKYREALKQASTADAEKQIEQWQNGYLRWGVHTMGFGFYLLRNK